MWLILVILATCAEIPLPMPLPSEVLLLLLFWLSIKLARNLNWQLLFYCACLLVTVVVVAESCALICFHQLCESRAAVVVGVAGAVVAVNKFADWNNKFGNNHNKSYSNLCICFSNKRSLLKAKQQQLRKESKTKRTLERGNPWFQPTTLLQASWLCFLWILISFLRNNCKCDRVPSCRLQ